MSVLDVGFSNKEYSDTDNFLEKHYPYPEQITALGIDEPTLFHKRYPAVRAVQYDGSIFPFPDQSFDICWSNAVVEHVGERDDQLRFLKEIRRVAQHGYITTPNKFFPVEVHTRVPLLHILLPKRLFDRFLRYIGKGWATGSYMRLLSKRDLDRLLRDAGFTSYRIVQNRIGLWTLDFVVLF